MEVQSFQSTTAEECIVSYSCYGVWYVDFGQSATLVESSFSYSCYGVWYVDFGQSATSVESIVYYCYDRVRDFIFAFFPCWALNQFLLGFIKKYPLRGREMGIVSIYRKGGQSATAAESTASYCCDGVRYVDFGQSATLVESKISYCCDGVRYVDFGQSIAEDECLFSYCCHGIRDVDVG